MVNDPKVLFLGTSSLTDRLGLTYNICPSFVTSNRRSKTRTVVTLHYAVALNGAVGGSVSVFGEAYGAVVYSVPDWLAGVGLAFRLPL